MTATAPLSSLRQRPAVGAHAHHAHEAPLGVPVVAEVAMPLLIGMVSDLDGHLQLGADADRRTGAAPGRSPRSTLVMPQTRTGLPRFQPDGHHDADVGVAGGRADQLLGDAGHLRGALLRRRTGCRTGR